MPTYEYRCKCGEEFEMVRSITSKPVAPCPKCGKKARRQISAGGGLIFKGKGFYITDYKNNGASRAASESAEKSAEKSAAPAPSETKNETKAAASESAKTTDSKPAAKSPA